MPKLLIIDDEPNLLYTLESSLRTDELDVLTAQTAKAGIELASLQAPDAIVLDIRLPDMSGLDALERLQHIDSRTPVIVITAHGTTDTAIEATKRGAFEYLLKPLDFHQLSEVVEKAIELSRLRHVPAVYDEGELSDARVVDRIVGRTAVMQDVYKAIGRVAPLDVNVLILGESGTGKELVARAVYFHSRRGNEPFLAINCAAIPETLLESELFGHERGAFTGADRRRIGKFEQANHGTLFLDEIGDMTLATQAKVLRLLQEQRFDRIGGNETVETDVRVITATNQNLEALVAAGRFRQDLYYRLKVYTIQLPPLRERMEDLPLLVDHFIRLFNREFGKQVRAASAETLERLAQHSWPGNIRELQNVVKYAMIHASGDVLTADCLPQISTASSALGGRPTGSHSADALDIVQIVEEMLRTGQPEIYRRLCQEVDRMVIDLALRHAQGNQVLASELLGISRNTLRAKLRSLSLSVQKQLLPESDHDAQELHRRGTELNC